MPKKGSKGSQEPQKSPETQQNLRKVVCILETREYNPAKGGDLGKEPIQCPDRDNIRSRG